MDNPIGDGYVQFCRHCMVQVPDVIQLSDCLHLYLNVRTSGTRGNRHIAKLNVLVVVSIEIVHVAMAVIQDQFVLKEIA